MTTLLLTIVSTALMGMGLILLSNWWRFPRLRDSTAADDGPKVSLLIPARNEAATIGQTVEGLLCQSYLHYELLLLDDHSGDGTASVAKAGAEGDSRLRILQGRPIPRGWLAKSWACQQLAAQARGEILIFADADVQWRPGALAALLCELERSRADMLALMPTQETVSWAERLCVPLMALAVHAYLPVDAVHHAPYPLLAAANGQCIAFTRAAYDRLGGHATVRDNILEDVGLARRVKRIGLRLRMAEADGLISCRMYHDWRSVREGYAKNILAGFGGVTGLFAGTAFHWLVFLVPWALLGFGFAGGVVPGHPLWALLLICAGILVRSLSALRTGQRVGDALLLPVSVLLMTGIAAQSLWWHWRYGGPLWKGRRALP